MNITESIMSALSGIMGNKMRSVLTMFGIVVGISSVILITSVGEGYRVSINSEFEKMGLDKVQVYTDSSDGKRIEYDDLLTYEDIETLRKYDEVIAVTANVSYGIGNAVELLDGEMATVMFNGVDEAYYNMEDVKFKHGRSIIDADVDGGMAVAVISEDFAMVKFGKTNCIGETIEFNAWGEKAQFKVIGVTESDAQSAMSMAYSWYQEMYVPISFVQNFFNGGDDTINSLTVKVADADDIPGISKNIVRILEMSHDNEGKYATSSVADYMAETDSVIGIFTMFMSIVAGISLLVGGIGVMNIMLVSVTERTREIGIRKSLGATNFNIQLQFLIEAVILTAIGGVIGLLFGYLGGKAFAFVAVMVTGMGMTPQISAGAVSLVVIISALIGIVFGVYPAAKAAKLDPIEALRFE